MESCPRILKYFLAFYSPAPPQLPPRLGIFCFLVATAMSATDGIPMPSVRSFNSPVRNLCKGPRALCTGEKLGSDSHSVHKGSVLSCTHILACAGCQAWGSESPEMTLLAGDMLEPTNRRWQAYMHRHLLYSLSPQHKSHEPLRMQYHTFSCESESTHLQALLCGLKLGQPQQLHLWRLFTKNVTRCTL